MSRLKACSQKCCTLWRCPAAGTHGPWHWPPGGIDPQMQRCRTCASSSLFTDAPSAHLRRLRTAASIAPGFKRYLRAHNPGEYCAQMHHLHKGTLPYPTLFSAAAACTSHVPLAELFKAATWQAGTKLAQSKLSLGPIIPLLQMRAIASSCNAMSLQWK